MHPIDMIIMNLRKMWKLKEPSEVFVLVLFIIDILA